MKVWIKYLIGAAIGIASALILPMDNEAVQAVVSFLLEIFIKLGRYIVVPLLICTGAMAVNELRASGLISKAAAWTFGIIVFSTIIIMAVGLSSILIVKLPRIPITVDTVDEVFSLHFLDLIRSLFPDSAFAALLEGSFLLVPFLFAFLVGWESATKKTEFRTVYSFLDSFSRLFYGIAFFFTEIMSVGMIAILCNWTFTFRSVLASGVYNPMFLMFAVDFVLVAGIIYPLVIYIFCKDSNPYRVLYASFCSCIAAFFSGDSNLTLPLNLRHGKEFLGVRRRISGFTYPLFSIFARGGTALVVVISFIVIWRSFSSLSIPVSDVIWVSILTFVLSFCLGGLPSGGAFVLLAILCNGYSKGLEMSFLLMKPAIPIICSFAALFDAVTAMAGSYIVAVKMKMIKHRAD